MINIRPVCPMVIVCASLAFCQMAHSQNVTLKWPKQAASQPSTQAKPKNEQSSALIDRRPLAGSVIGRAYINKFFDFSIQFPENWIKVWVDQGPQEDSKKVVYFLVLAGSPDKRMGGTRWVTIFAARPLGSALSETAAQNAVETEANGLNLVTSMGLAKGFRPTGKPSTVVLGGRRATRLRLAAEVEIRGSKYDTRETQLILIERGYMLFFISSDPVNRESDAESAVKTLDSLRFLGEGHRSAQ